MTLTLFVTENCSSCNRVEKQVQSLIKDKDNIYFMIDNISTVQGKGIIIAPALFIDDELYAYGDINENKFLKRINVTEKQLT